MPADGQETQSGPSTPDATQPGSKEQGPFELGTFELPPPSPNAVRGRVHLFANLIIVGASLGGINACQAMHDGGLAAFASIFVNGAFFAGLLYGISLLSFSIERLKRD